MRSRLTAHEYWTLPHCLRGLQKSSDEEPGEHAGVLRPACGWRASKQTRLGDHHIHRTVRQLGLQRRSGLGLPDLGHSPSLLIRQQGIAALQHQARVQQLQAQVDTIKRLLLLLQIALEDTGKIGL